jgi:hypothetical protein
LTGKYFWEKFRTNLCMSSSTFLEKVKVLSYCKVGSKARITGSDGNVQTLNDHVKSPMIKSFRSRDIPLITRKWKEKRKVKIWHPKPDTVNELTTEALIKSAQKLGSSAPSADDFSLDIINATLLKMEHLNRPLYIKIVN